MNNLYDLNELDEQIKNAKKNSPSLLNTLFSTLKKIIFISILPILIYTIFTYFIGVTCMDQDSMLPNFSKGDFIFYNRLADDFKIGDIIIFKDDSNDTLSTKRVIASSNESVEIIDNQIYINERLLKESWITQGKTTPIDMISTITLKDDELFVLGDNRSESIDSRSNDVGVIHKDQIVGKFIYKFKMSN